MKKKIALFSVSVCLLLLGVVPYVWGAVYTIPGIDDLCVATDIRNINGGFLSKAIINACDLYFSWQGTYFTNLLIGLIRPYDMFGTMGLRIYTVTMLILFSLAFIYVIYIFLEVIDSKDRVVNALLYGGLLLLIVFNVNYHTEFFYFNIVIHAYTAPFILGLIALAYLAKCYRFQQRGKYYFIGLIIGFMACGGILQVSAIMSYYSLIIALKKYKSCKKVKTNESFFFVIMFIGSCINTFSPGNFNRANNDSVFAFSNLLRAVFNSSYVVALELRHILLETYTPFYILIFIVILYLTGIEYNKKLKGSLWKIAIHTLLGSIIATFPVVLGHNSTYMENRNTTILDFELVIGIFFIAYVFYNECFASRETKTSQIINIAIIIFVGMMCFNQNYDFSEQPSFEAIHELLNGRVQQYSEDMDVVLNYLNNSSGVVETPHVHCEQGVIFRLDIQEDSAHWINKGVAEYYGLQKVYMNKDLEVNDLRLMGY